MNTYSSKIQVNEPSLQDKKHNSGREMSGNSNESQEKDGDRLVRDVLYEGHAGNHEQDSGEKFRHEHFIST